MNALEKKIFKKPDNFILGIKLFIVRRSVGMNQRQFSQMIGISFDKYQRIESGYSTNDFAVLVRIALIIEQQCNIDGSYFLLCSIVDIETAPPGTSENHQKISEILSNRELFAPIPDDARHRLPINLKIGASVSRLRKLFDMSQEQFASMFDISVDRLVSLEKGQTMRDYSLFIKIFEYADSAGMDLLSFIS